MAGKMRAQRAGRAANLTGAVDFGLEYPTVEGRVESRELRDEGREKKGDGGWGRGEL
jgi:hypothetical protein